MAERSMVEEDPILPVRILHNSEQIYNGNSLEQDYNYLMYEFETELYQYRARAYLDEIQTVAIYGPFDKGSIGSTSFDGIEIDQRVLSYLRRRYSEVKRFVPS